MGVKHSSDKPSRTSLNPNEMRRLSMFLVSKGSHSQFNRDDMHRLWKDHLVPDLLKSYSDYLMTLARGNQNFIGVDEFVRIYSLLVRGDSVEKVSALGGIIGMQKKGSGHMVTSFNALRKYLADLLESYFLGLKTQKDMNYTSWTYHKHPERTVIEQVAHGICIDLRRTNDDVELTDLELWLNQSGVVSVLHSYVLGSLYNLDPEIVATVIPQAILPTTKTKTFLDLSQVLYINSHIPFENKTKWRFLFSTHTHGESFSKLVGTISNSGSIIIVIHSENNCTFGGFISEAISPGPRWVGTSDCFIFKLSPIAEIFPATGYNDHYVYFNQQQQSLPNGLGMGGQYNYWGLYIDSQFGQGECSESCTTYKDYKMLATKKRFHILNMEAWGVGDPPPTDEERGERPSRGTLVMDRESVHTQILEMAGRKMYSKGIGRDIPQ